MKTKVLITIKDGIFQDAYTNSEEVEIAVMDFDDNGEEPVIIYGPTEPDGTFKDGESWKIFEKPTDAAERYARMYLKKIKF